MRIQIADKTVEICSNHELTRLEVSFDGAGEANTIMTIDRSLRIWSAGEHQGCLETISGEMPVGVYLV